MSARSVAFGSVLACGLALAVGCAAFDATPEDEDPAAAGDAGPDRGREGEGGDGAGGGADAGTDAVSVPVADGSAPVPPGYDGGIGEVLRLTFGATGECGPPLVAYAGALLIGGSGVCRICTPAATASGVFAALPSLPAMGRYVASVQVRMAGNQPAPDSAVIAIRGGGEATPSPGPFLFDGNFRPLDADPRDGPLGSPNLFILASGGGAGGGAGGCFEIDDLVVTRVQ